MCKGDTGESAKIKSTIHATKWSLVNSACYPASTAPTSRQGAIRLGKVPTTSVCRGSPCPDGR